MQRSTSRILTTHIGSLPRPEPVRDLLCDVRVSAAARVHPEIMWAKFEALVEGARQASDELWS